MKSLTRFAIIAAAALSVAWGQEGTVRRSESEIDEAYTYHRHLVEDNAECVLYLKVTHFSDGRPDQRTWSCKFQQDSVRSTGTIAHKMNVEGISKDVIDSYGPISGEATMRMQGAYIRQSIINGVSTLVVPDAASFNIEKLTKDDPRHHRQKRKNSRDDHRVIGTRRTLVVRVTDNEGNVMVADTDQLMEDVFNDEANMRSQYAACSFNQLMFEPSTEGGGVIEMTVSASKTDYDAMAAASLSALYELYGGEEGVVDKFENVLFCFPDDDDGKSGFAYYNDYDSYYNGEVCLSMSFLMHEIGHNLGMGHSGVEDEYDDETCMMGYSYREDDTPLKCFNPAKNWQLGWYSEQELALDPFTIIGNPQTYVLNGIVDYQTSGSPEGKVVVLRIIEYGDDSEAGNDYYLGFNRASGFNIDTKDIPDQVGIWTKPKEGPYGSGPSFRTKDLVVGETFSISNFKGSAYSLYIEWVSLSSDGKDATVQVSLSDEGVTSIPSPAPTFEPTYEPTYEPTSGDSCEDDSTFMFKNKTNKTCKKWVAKGSNNLDKNKNVKKIKKKCKKKWEGKRVWEYCPATCALVSKGPCA